MHQGVRIKCCATTSASRAPPDDSSFLFFLAQGRTQLERRHDAVLHHLCSLLVARARQVDDVQERAVACQRHVLVAPVQVMRQHRHDVDRLQMRLCGVLRRLPRRFEGCLDLAQRLGPGELGPLQLGARAARRGGRAGRRQIPAQSCAKS